MGAGGAAWLSTGSLSGETAVAVPVVAMAAAAVLVSLRARLARRRARLLAWLAGGAEVFAGAAATRSAGRRHVTIRVEQTAPPFRAVALAVRLDPAGLALLPAWAALRRRLAARDRLTVQSELHRPPRAEFDFFFARTPEGRAAAAAARDARWRVSEVGAPSSLGLGALALAEPTGGGIAPRDGLLAIGRRIEELSAEVRRVAVRRRSPHLLAEVVGPGASGAVTAQALFDLLRDAAYLAQGPGRRD